MVVSSAKVTPSLPSGHSITNCRVQTITDSQQRKKRNINVTIRAIIEKGSGGADIVP